MMTPLELQDIQIISESDICWEKLKNKSVFVSGGTGFVGGTLIDVLRYRNERYGDNIDIIACSRHKSGTERGVRYIRHDINNPVDASFTHLDYILHLASNTHPKQYSEDPVGTITTNVFGAYNLLSLAKVYGSRFFLASSVEIYGDGNGKPIDENFCGYINCNTSRAGYNESKRVTESLCQSFKQQYGTDCVIARLARIYGADKKNDTKAMSQFISDAVNHRDIVLKSDGKQRYSYLYIVDAITGILKILLEGKSGEAYNIAPDDDGKTLGDYAGFIAGYSGTKAVYDFVGQAGSSNAVYAILDNTKLKEIGWSAKFDVESGLARTIEIFRERQ